MKRGQFYLLAFALLILTLPYIYRYIPSFFAQDTQPVKPNETFPSNSFYFLLPLVVKSNSLYSFSMASTVETLYETTPTFLVNKTTPLTPTIVCQKTMPIYLPPVNYNACQEWIAGRGYNCELTFAPQQSFSVYVQGGNVSVVDLTTGLTLFSFSLLDNQSVWITRDKTKVFVYKLSTSSIDSFLSYEENITPLANGDQLEILADNVVEIRSSNYFSIPVGEGLLLPFANDCVNNITYFYSLSNNAFLTLANVTLKAYAVNVYNPYTSDLSDVQVKIQLPTEFQNADIVVTDSNGNVIPFCFETANGECSTNPLDGDGYIWVKIPTLPSGVNTIIYINWFPINTAVTGDKVFDFYDDFNEATLDTNKWIVENVTYSLANGEICITSVTGSPGMLEANYSFYGNTIVEGKVKVDTVALGSANPLIAWNTTLQPPNIYSIGYNTTISNDFIVTDTNGISEVNYITGILLDSLYHYFAIAYNSTNNALFNIDTNNFDPAVSSQTGPFYFAILYSKQTANTVTNYCADWIRVRKYYPDLQVYYIGFEPVNFFGKPLGTYNPTTQKLFGTVVYPKLFYEFIGK